MPEGLTIADVIAISGHRVYPDRAALFRGLDQLQAREYYFGGARGADSDALEYIARTQPRSVRTVVVPNRIVDQPRATIPVTKRYSTRVIELGNRGPDRFMVRNRFMVDKADHLRAFYDYRGKGGTYNTINYARLQGKPVTITNMVSTDMSDYLAMSEKDFRAFMNKAQENNLPLTCIKGVVVRFFNNLYEYIPSDVVVQLRSW